MKYSSLDADSYTWTEIPMKDKDGELISNSRSCVVNGIIIQNASGSDRVFRINKGAPFLVQAESERSLGLAANQVGMQFFKIEVDTATLTDIHVDMI